MAKHNFAIENFASTLITGIILHKTSFIAAASNGDLFLLFEIQIVCLVLSLEPAIRHF